MKKFAPALSILALLLFLAGDAFAQAATMPTHPASPGEIFMRMIPMFVIVFFIFYFLVLKPQQAKIKAQESLLSNLKRGDSVVTTGGLIGKVAGTEKGCAILEVAPNVRVKVELTHVIKKHDETVEVVAAEKVKSS